MGGKKLGRERDVPTGTEKSEDRFDFERFHGEIDRVLGEEFEDKGELLSRLGVCLCNAVMLNLQIAGEIRHEFVEYVTRRLTMLEHKKPGVIGLDFVSRRDFARTAVGVAFDLLANAIDASENIGMVKGDTRGQLGAARRWIGEGRSRGTGGKGNF